MAQKVIVPRLGQTMTEGTVARFFVKDGDKVTEGTPIYELEYDKSTAPVAAKRGGTVRLLVSEGTVVKLGNPVAVILEDGETLESAGFGAAPTAAAPAAAAPAPAAAAASYDADVIVIGGGPGGYVCANKLGMLGKKVILGARPRWRHLPQPWLHPHQGFAPER